MTGRESRFDFTMILFLHNRYRTTGGEERVVEDLRRLVHDQLGEQTELLTEDSTGLSRSHAALGLLRGGIRPQNVREAVRNTGAQVVHAHNLHPSFGWRALRAARQEGARVCLHLHQYRLICAVGVCFTEGQECTRCHGRNTMPGVLRNCRGSVPESLTYAVSLALWQSRMIEFADAIIVPSEFARQRLQQMGVSLPYERVHVLAPPVASQFSSDAPTGKGGYALVVSRLAPEKGVDIAIRACLEAKLPLVIAGDGPLRQSLQQLAGGGDVSFVGSVDAQKLAELRAGAAIAIVPSRSAETFGMALAEAMAAGLPVVGSRVGALPELIEQDGLVEPGDASALAQALKRVWHDTEAGKRGRERVRALCAPEAVAKRLRVIYGLPGGA